MREIEFRGKDTHTGKWVKGLLVSTEPASIAGIDVDPETVGQYTGLLDRNGVKVFEGDILSVNTARGSEPHYKKRVVEWKTPYFSGFVYDKAEYKAQYHEAIGNIHDNPKLLEALNGK